MLKIDINRMVPNIAQIMMLRGSGILPVLWSEHPNRSAKEMLESYEDDVLFDGVDVKDKGMAAAVGSLLFLWTGWLDEAFMMASIAGEAERAYLYGLIERHRGDSDKSKGYFRELDGHEIYPQLVDATATILRDVSDSKVARFRGLLELDVRWEPFAFSDVFTQARCGMLDADGEELIRRMSRYEFEVLLHYCYKGATGVDIAEVAGKSDESSVEIKDRMAKVRRLRDKHTHRAEVSASSGKVKYGDDGKGARKKKNKGKGTDKAEGSALALKESEQAGAIEMVRFRCPKCGEIASVDESMRGSKVKCLKCGVAIGVPRSKGKAGGGGGVGGVGGGGANSSSNMVRMSCPNCGRILEIPGDMRGKTVRCDGRKAGVKVPMAKAAARV